MDIQLLRTSFASFIETAPDLTERFYRNLFTRYPTVQALFGRHSARQQQEMLAQALAAVLDHIEDASWLTETLQALGRKHQSYGVTAEMYDWVGEALLTTFAEIAGPAWSSELRDVWLEAYSAIATLMQSGAEASQARARAGRK